MTQQVSAAITRADVDHWTGPSYQVPCESEHPNRALCKTRQYRWARLLETALDLCLAMRFPGRSASRLLLPSLSCTSSRTPSSDSTACKPHQCISEQSYVSRQPSFAKWDLPARQLRGMHDQHVHDQCVHDQHTHDQHFHNERIHGQPSMLAACLTVRLVQMHCHASGQLA